MTRQNRKEKIARKGGAMLITTERGNTLALRKTTTKATVKVHLMSLLVSVVVILIITAINNARRKHDTR